MTTYIPCGQGSVWGVRGFVYSQMPEMGIMGITQGMKLNVYD